MEPLLPALSNHLDCTSEATEDIHQAAKVPASSSKHEHLKDIALEHFKYIVRAVDCIL